MDITQLGRISSVLFTGDGQSITYQLRVIPLVVNCRRIQVPVSVDRRCANFYLQRQYYSLDCAALSLENERKVEEFILKLAKKAFPGIIVEHVVVVESEECEAPCEVHVRVKNIQSVLRYSICKL